MEVDVDRDACVAAGQCALVAGEVFDQDDDGLVELLTAAPGAEQRTAVERAAALCPARAIRVRG
ncbi:ferredoxin [Microlunatus capsulatus]|uniref:Ferredoxin n=1 Tax=Microlunatus capsulatus TaxID=99117 RepID=A0ABS4Z3J7_9ACTN|nr:ferredoxin [Microlunatus capsulatus]MBP2415365.1 ferredoxin [Microlunatus capsulatus]